MDDLRQVPAGSVWERLLSKRLHIQIGILATLFAILYAPVFGFLLQTWRGRDDYNHGFLVPFIALYFVWMQRRQLGKLEVAPSVAGGLPWMGLAGLMLLLGKLGSVVVLQDLSLPVMIAGLVLLLSGKEYLEILALPIGYLLFMIPIFGVGSDWVHWPFQLLAANIGTWLLQSLGFAALREAQYIQLPQVTLEVAQACSGLRFLMAVVAIGIPLAYFSQRTWLRGVGLVGFAVAVAILANALRVALIGVWVYYGGRIVHGPFHVLQGLFAAWIGFVALFAGAWFLHKGPKGSRDLALS